MHGSKRTAKTKKRTAPLQRSRPQKQNPQSTNYKEFVMPILFQNETSESSRLSPGWLGGCGWLWLQSHEPLLETTNLFDFFSNVCAANSVKLTATPATTTTATPSLQREVN